MNTSNTIFYRPEWTCGKYNIKHKAAIFYNLLEGMSFFFEDYSAFVVSQLLDVPRNSPFTIEQIAKSTGISEESILPFFQNLQGLGLIINHVPTQEEISDYRMQLSKAHKTQAQTVAKTTKETLPMDVSTAEMDYANKVGGAPLVFLSLIP